MEDNKAYNIHLESHLSFFSSFGSLSGLFPSILERQKKFRASFFVVIKTVYISNELIFWNFLLLVVHFLSLYLSLPYHRAIIWWAFFSKKLYQKNHKKLDLARVQLFGEKIVKKSGKFLSFFLFLISLQNFLLLFFNACIIRISYVSPKTSIFFFSAFQRVTFS